MTRRHALTAVSPMALLAVALAGCGSRSPAPRPGPAPGWRRWCSPRRTSRPVCSTSASSREPGQPDGAARRPPCCPRPEGCSDGLTRVIADSAERGAGSAAEYLVGYDGARMVMTVLTWPLDLERLAATAERCAQFETFFDPSAPGIPMTTTKLETPRADALVYRADHAAEQRRGQRLLLVRERRRDGGVRHRVSRRRIRPSGSKPRCRRRFWTSQPSKPSARSRSDAQLGSTAKPARPARVLPVA